MGAGALGFAAVFVATLWLVSACGAVLVVAGRRWLRRAGPPSSAARS